MSLMKTIGVSAFLAAAGFGIDVACARRISVRSRLALEEEVSGGREDRIPEFKIPLMERREDGEVKNTIKSQFVPEPEALGRESEYLNTATPPNVKSRILSKTCGDKPSRASSIDYEPLFTRSDHRPELTNQDYWHPKSRNFEIIDWDKWESICGRFPQGAGKVYDPPQRSDPRPPPIERGDEMSWWQRSQINFPQDWPVSGKPKVGQISDCNLEMLARLLGPHPDSRLVPQPLRNNLLWTEDNDVPETLISFNRGAWRPNTRGGRPVGLAYVGTDWTSSPNWVGRIIAGALADTFINFQVSPNGKWIKLATIGFPWGLPHISPDPGNSTSLVRWLDMYIVQEGDVFEDAYGNVLTDVEPGDIVRYDFGTTTNPYACGALSFMYFPRKVAVLDENSGKIEPSFPQYNRLLDFVTRNPSARLHLQTLGFTNASSLSKKEKFDFYVSFLSDYQMYSSAPTPPHGDDLEF